MRDFIDIRKGDPQQRNEADEEERMKTLLRHLAVWRAAWQIERTMPSAVVSGGSAVEFLPAVLEIQHTPPSPIGRAILWTIMLVFTTAAAWSSLSHIDIVAVAPGKIIPSGHSKTVQPFETGVIASIHVQDEDFALQEGLIPKSEHSEIYSNSGHPSKEDFITFANRNGVLPKKRDAIIKMFSANNPLIDELIKHSFLNDKTKRMYKQSYQERLSRFLR